MLQRCAMINVAKTTLIIDLLTFLNAEYAKKRICK